MVGAGVSDAAVSAPRHAHAYLGFVVKQDFVHWGVDDDVKAFRQATCSTHNPGFIPCKQSDPTSQQRQADAAPHKHTHTHTPNHTK